MKRRLILVALVLIIVAVAWKNGFNRGYYSGQIHALTWVTNVLDQKLHQP